jgi:hypothetical protein
MHVLYAISQLSALAGLVGNTQAVAIIPIENIANIPFVIITPLATVSYAELRPSCRSAEIAQRGELLTGRRTTLKKTAEYQKVSSLEQGILSTVPAS